MRPKGQILKYEQRDSSNEMKEPPEFTSAEDQLKLERACFTVAENLPLFVVKIKEGFAEMPSLEGNAW